MVAHSFSRKILQFSFSPLSGGSPVEITAVQNDANAAPWKGPACLRASAIIMNLGGPASGTLEGAIYGLPLSTMNQLTSMGNQLNAYGQKFAVSVSAGDDRSQGLSLVFTGVLFDAYMDGMASMPRVPFRFRATAEGVNKVKMINPTSSPGQVDVASLMQQIAGQAGLKFQNSGVNVKVTNPYLPGSIWTQICELASMAGVQHILDRGVLAIWPTQGSRQGGGGVVSPKTGMVGYPAFESANVVVKTLFDPTYQFGSNFTVQSDVTPANGTWNCNKLIYELEAEMPSGKWFLTMWGAPVGQQIQTSSK